MSVVLEDPHLDRLVLLERLGEARAYLASLVVHQLGDQGGSKVGSLVSLTLSQALVVLLLQLLAPEPKAV
eukprot:6821822-Heterocapsa_arctica.AAC.1